MFNGFIKNFLHYLVLRGTDTFDKEDFEEKFEGHGVEWFLNYNKISLGIDNLLKLSIRDRSLLYDAFCTDINFASSIDSEDFEFKFPLLPLHIRIVAKPFFEALYDDILGGTTGIRMNSMSISYLKREHVRKGFFDKNRKRCRNINSTCPACLGEISPKGEDGYADLDHYLTKSVYPVLSLSSDNLIPICKTCNQSTVKGSKNPLQDYQMKGGLLNIFIPYHRVGIDFIEIDIESKEPDEQVKLRAKREMETQSDRISNFENLFNLNERWTGKINSSINEVIAYAVLDSVLESANNSLGLITEELVRGELRKRHKSSRRSYQTAPDMFLHAEYLRIIMNDPAKFKGFFYYILELALLECN
ncbi:hypothetical protein CN899_21935 [Bacillus thuringiensis]|uniref:HNH endonuclease n=1 Tax=Bacillus thuringiensis TaxID=1428 RepID=A0A9X7GH45_BACTU|nr:MULTISPECIES: hypothetical protein [Bacillus cereus group]ALC52357.1 hypothetical protein ACN91_12420 [Bacillus cereus]PGH80386.1 hypothetical protein CN899_21935 [Bacillus thuringiensis]